MQNNNSEIINIKLDETIVHPFPSFYPGKPMEDLYPFLEREEFREQMITKPLDDKSLDELASKRNRLE